MILEGPIALNIIQAFRGTVDLYCRKGQWCARAWPRKPTNPATATQQTTRTAVRNAMTIWTTIPGLWNEQWRAYSSLVGTTTADARRSVLIAIAKLNPTLRPIALVSQAWEPLPDAGFYWLRCTYVNYPGCHVDQALYRTWPAGRGTPPPIRRMVSQEPNHQGFPRPRYGWDPTGWTPAAHTHFLWWITIVRIAFYPEQLPAPYWLATWPRQPPAEPGVQIILTPPQRAPDYHP
jgi:hypothetical protein